MQEKRPVVVRSTRIDYQLVNITIILTSASAKQYNTVGHRPLLVNCHLRKMSSAVKTKSARGCWTCKDRRVKCDRGLPRCANCARLQQECLGYGVRLSWPREGDTKRSIVGRPIAPLVRRRREGTGIELVHTSYFDIEMYHYLIELHSSGVEDRAVVQPASLILPLPMPSRPTNLNAEEVELLRYWA